MKQFLHLKAGSAFLVLIFIAMLYACNHQPKTPVVTEPADTQKPDPIAFANISNVLDTLFILKTDIGIPLVTGTKRLVFRYRIEGNELTLDGWSYFNNDQSPEDPDDITQPVIKFKRGNHSAVSLTNGMYLTSLVLHKSDLNKIIKALKPDSIRSLILVPKLDNYEPDKFIWEINVSTSTTGSSFKVDKLAKVPGAQFNPSPPREFSK